MHIDDLAALVERTTPRLGSTKLVAVDGPGGAGKSTLAAQLAAACTATLLHTDDFASWDNQFDWWPQLEQQVLSPIALGRAGRYQRYDWDTKTLAEWRDVAPPAVLILEGVSAGRASVRERLSLLVWVQTPPAVRLARGLDRDGDGALSQWQRWMAEEDVHFAADRTQQHADVIISGQAIHLPEPSQVEDRFLPRGR
ncbi:uridine kinase [Nocardia sp. NPDC057272]|uniref:uridine kinase family protein n=1 Tax=Nocardia sp. NPDC057272 TaxID=3346079 RepID=UPI00363B5B98